MQLSTTNAMKTTAHEIAASHSRTGRTPRPPARRAPRRHALSSSVMALGMAVGMAMSAGPASASFVYTYTSMAFQTASAPLTTSDQITFVFETAAAIAAGAETRLNATPDFFNP